MNDYEGWGARGWGLGGKCSDDISKMKIVTHIFSLKKFIETKSVVQTRGEL